MYFTQEYLDFFKQLASNNHKNWFDEHRSDYEKFVKNPFYNFIEKLFVELEKKEPNFVAYPRKSIYRINRDIRFSKDKTPYKLHMSSVISPTGKKGMDEACLYIQFSPESCLIGGGIYAPSSEYLLKLRTSLADYPEKIKDALGEKTFKNFFGNLDDTVDKNKILPKELKEKAEIFPLLYYKKFLFFRELEPEFILKKNLIEEILKFYTIAQPVNKLLTV